MTSRSITIDHRYLILPVRRGPVQGRMRLLAGGTSVREFDIELGDSKASDYEVFSDLAPFQGMIIMTREDATGSSGPVPVFDEATASLTLHAVPVRLDIEGPFLSPTATAPVSSALSKGFNLMAPHIWADTPFDTVFAGSGDDIS